MGVGIVAFGMCCLAHCQLSLHMNSPDETRSTIWQMVINRRNHRMFLAGRGSCMFSQLIVSQPFIALSAAYAGLRYPGVAGWVVARCGPSFHSPPSCSDPLNQLKATYAPDDAEMVRLVPLTTRNFVYYCGKPNGGPIASSGLWLIYSQRRSPPGN